MKISLIHPSRNRPNQAFLTRLNWFDKADGEFEYILSVDSDDSELAHYQYNFPGNQRVLISPNKTAIEAINRAAVIATGDILIVVSDDTDCPPHWDTSLLGELAGKCDFVVKCRDGIQAVLITMPVMDRKYYNRFGYIYHPDYLHMSCDVELTAVGMMLGRAIQSNLLFKHLHYSTGKTQKDAINEKNDLTYKQGDEVLARHRVNNFGIANPVMKYEDIDWHPNPVILSILIATMPSRSGHLFRLAGQLTPQLVDQVEVIIDCSMEYNIGTKRNKLLETARGEYIIFADDDDSVSADYVEKIVKATIGKPDCIGISGVISTNGCNTQQWHISKEYGNWYEADNIYYRTPNHISPVRRELALQAAFPEIDNGEDAEYSRRLFPLLKKENIVEGNIYHYNFWSK